MSTLPLWFSVPLAILGVVLGWVVIYFLFDQFRPRGPRRRR